MRSQILQNNPKCLSLHHTSAHISRVGISDFTSPFLSIKMGLSSSRFESRSCPKYDDSTLLSVVRVVLYMTPPTSKTTGPSFIGLWSVAVPLEDGARIYDRAVPVLFIRAMFDAILPRELPLAATQLLHADPSAAPCLTQSSRYRLFRVRVSSCAET